ncbi:hypothetical protein WMF38_27980 [Sorangium sp. So ce118]
MAAQGAAAHVEQVLEEVGGFAYGLQWLGERLRREGDVDEECTTVASFRWRTRNVSTNPGGAGTGAGG